LRGRRHLRERRGNVDILLKENLDHTVTVQGLRLDMFDIGNLCAQGSLVIVNDATGHIVGQKPVIGPDDADHRNIDVWKYVGRGADGGKPTENGDQESEHHKGIGAPQGGLNDPHEHYLQVAFAAFVARTSFCVRGNPRQQSRLSRRNLPSAA
jgi:uncharacterized Fe-S cluster protein YjdI